MIPVTDVVDAVGGTSSRRLAAPIGRAFPDEVSEVLKKVQALQDLGIQPVLIGSYGRECCDERVWPVVAVR